MGKTLRWTFVATTVALLLQVMRQGRLYPLAERDLQGVHNLSGAPPVVEKLADREAATSSPIKVIPQPVFVLSFPKSGTTTTWRYFNCNPVSRSVYRAAHTYTQFRDASNSVKTVRIARCFKDNFDRNLPLAQGCGGHNVWTDAGQCWVREKQNTLCFYPSMHGLENIRDHYPNATIMLVVRNTTSWYKSFEGWNNGRLRRDLSSIPDVGFPMNGTMADWMAFYEAHTDSIRRFMSENPTLNYIEVTLESALTPAIMEEQTGIPTSCWRDCHPDRACNNKKPPTGDVLL
jgi:hypothetical protein